MIKHVGRHNNRKVAILYKTVPDEDHMALVIYTETIPSLLHDEMMGVLESAVGQESKELSDALFRHTMADGNNCLQALHKGGYMKKVPTKQVIVTVNANSSCRLDELNDILKQMEGGEEAVKRLAEMDANAGILGGRDVGEPKTTQTQALTDADLAKQRLDQADQMEAEANSLIAEAKRLRDEASSLTPKAKDGGKSKTAKKTAA